MANSYRIRTELGINKQIQVNLNQEYDFLEILSLKFRPEEIYPRSCSDFGVITGRVIANSGYGIPNAKVSVFVPLSSEDAEDPVISTLYPYTRVGDVNEDGYRYNLLPYTKQHGGHTPTGTFPSINDALVDNTVVEIYDKYYKFTVKTNESGDYMIFGVPLGNQTVVMDLDLSDMGPFSLTPQDLIRMGRATETQFESAATFKASENIDSLPQIVNQIVNISVEPFWGQDDLCQTKIHRLDFDLRKLGIEIEPTAVFIGSMISDVDKYKIKRKCKPAREGGDLCNLTVAPGKIFAIRQTIFVDSDNRPILEEHKLEGGGKIDEDGTWVVDVPMNLDYVVTNEVGETVLSADPSVGIPTSAKYRFKIKWQQSEQLTDGVRRGYYLVPNIREYGWTTYDNDPVPSASSGIPSPPPQDVLYSYAFSLDWNDYGNTGTTVGNQMISDAINCVDKFYVFKYKKLYTVSQLIDQYHNGFGKQRFIGIKEITDTRCESENNKFPTTDGVRNSNLLYLIFTNILLIIYFLMVGLLVPIHLIAYIAQLFCQIYNAIIIPACNLLRRFGLRRRPCPPEMQCMGIFAIRLPMLTYPDCELCEDCKAEVTDTSTAINEQIPGIEDQSVLFLAPIDVTSVNVNTSCLTQGDFLTNNAVLVLQAGRYFGEANNLLTGFAQDSFNRPWRHTSMFINTVGFGNSNYLGEDRYFACELPFAEKINLFNTKAKYFDGDFGGSFENGGIGGANQIKVYIEPTLNNSATTYHHDNTYILIVDPQTLEEYTQGRIISFQDPILSTDFNITGDSGSSIIGSGVTGPTQISVTYANPQDTSFVLNPVPLTTIYNVNFTDDSPKYKYPTDIEYFQVITGMTYSDFMSKTNPSGVNDFASRYLNYVINIKSSEKFYSAYSVPLFSGPPYDFSGQINPDDFFCDSQNQPFNQLSICKNTIEDICSISAITAFNNYQNFGIIILNRGVDVNTERVNISYDLSRIFGYTAYTDNNIINGSYKLNIPIQPKYRLPNHVNLLDNANDGSSLDGFVFYPSYNADFNSSFSSYTTNLHTYYSSLDLSAIFSNFTVNSNYPWTQLTPNYLTFGGQVELRSGGPTNPIFTGCGGYFETTFGGNNIGEYIEGGSYAYQRPEGYFVYEPSCQSSFQAPTANDCVENEETFIYFAPKYDSGNTLTVSASTRLVFRSDRLPTSTNLDIDTNYLGSIGTQANSAPGQQNNDFLIYSYNDDSNGVADGQPWLNLFLTATTQSDADSTNTSTDISGDSQSTDAIIASLSCDSLVDLSCYQQGYPINILPETDACNKTGPNIAVKNGCYILVKRAITDLTGPNNDFDQLGEWVGRLRLNIGACLGVISHTFVNSWVNGVLYHFAIKNNRFFDSNNQPYSRYCSDVVILDPKTNNFYYRSSPYNINTNQFVGKKAPEKTVQPVNLLFPTTIMDLGPVNSYTSELIYGPDYEGFVVNKLKPTSYQDVTEILQLFFLSRLINAGSLSLALGVGANSGVASLFANGRGNNKKRIDGDYAQSIQINSQFGVFEFSPDQYDDVDILFDDVDNSGLLGIFFKGINQDRDLISPRRIIFDENGPNVVGQQIPVFTQEIPHYKWSIDTGGFPSLIFGTQDNDWVTDSITSAPYQLQDRTLANNFFRGDANSAAFAAKGFITNVNTNGVNVPAFGSSGPNPSQIGGPWYFYFGLKNAATALDKFFLKYVE